MNIFLSTWCLVVAGLVFSFPMICLRIRDTTVLEDEGLYVTFFSFVSLHLLSSCIMYRMQRDQEINDMREQGMIESRN
jgi:hypothetical protein